MHYKVYEFSDEYDNPIVVVRKDGQKYTLSPNSEVIVPDGAEEIGQFTVEVEAD